MFYKNILYRASEDRSTELFNFLNSPRYRQQEGPHNMDDLVSKPVAAPIKDPAYVQLVRIALCYYIAKADQVKPEEQKIIDSMCEELLGDPSASMDYKTELRMILADRGTSFTNVRRYLNRIDPKDLEAFWKDVMDMAKVSGDISDNEKKALVVYQSYVEERLRVDKVTSGRTFTGKPGIISLKCTNCSAVLEVNSDLSIAFCPYCGTKHIIYDQGKESENA